jgi:type VII secretion-associated serine protease mycosin
MLRRACRAVAILVAALPVLAAGGPVRPAPARSSLRPVRAVSAVLRAADVAPGVRSAEQAQLRAVGATAAWRVTRGSGVTIGVLDSGADATVPDLTGSVIAGPDYTTGANPAGYQPPHLHGTYISSLIAGHGSGPSDADGVIGVAPAATILSVRVILDDQEPGFTTFHNDTVYNDSVGNGIRYAVRHGAGVINMSLGGDTPTRDLRAAIAYAIAHRVVVVAAAGNDAMSASGFTPYSYPASFPGVISVAAVGADGRRAFFSDRNASVVLSAPGVNVVGAGPGGSYLDGSGTSPASAIVAGVAALIRSRYPRLSPVQVEQAMISSASRRPAGGYSPDVGFGEVDAPAALTAAARLAAAHADMGLAAARRFGRDPGPVQVVHRDTARIGGYVAAAAVLTVAAAVLLTWLIVRIRRFRMGHRELNATLLSKSHITALESSPCLSSMRGLRMPRYRTVHPQDSLYQLLSSGVIKEGLSLWSSSL